MNQLFLIRNWFDFFFDFRVSNSPDLGGVGSDYIQAERMGRELGDCKIYHAKCPRSLFHYADNNLH